MTDAEERETCECDEPIVCFVCESCATHCLTDADPDACWEAPIGSAVLLRTEWMPRGATKMRYENRARLAKGFAPPTRRRPPDAPDAIWIGFRAAPAEYGESETGEVMADARDACGIATAQLPPRS